MIESVAAAAKEVAKYSSEVGKKFELPSFAEKLGEPSIKSLKEADKPLVKELSKTEKRQIYNESGWSKNVVNDIKSISEYEIYKSANLEELIMGEKHSLAKNNLDWKYKDSMGRTNLERIKAGLTPINKYGEKIELHHIGQKSDSALAELSETEHGSKGNYSILHNNFTDSQIDRRQFAAERKEYWKERFNNLKDDHNAGYNIESYVSASEVNKLKGDYNV